MNQSEETITENDIFDAGDESIASIAEKRFCCLNRMILVLNHSFLHDLSYKVIKWKEEFPAHWNSFN